MDGLKFKNRELKAEIGSLNVTISERLTSEHENNLVV